MNKFVRPIAKPATVTVGDLIGHLCRWPDQAVVTFKSRVDGRGMSFGQIESRSKGHIEIELDVAPEYGPSIAPAAEPANEPH
jgi:hypothetical protein